LLIIITGTVGYLLTEEWNFFDSFFMTIITISTVGYGTPDNLSNTGKVFTSVLILLSLTVVVYAFSKITAFFVEGNMNRYLRRRKLLKEIDKLRNHYIIVGGGNLGLNVLRELIKYGKKVVIIENNDSKINEIKILYSEYDNLTILAGNAKNEEILEEANIKNAEGLVATLNSDSENVFVVLTARNLNRDLKIISLVNDHVNSKKLEFAGANRTIPLDEIGANRIRNLMLNPEIVGFLDSINKTGDVEIMFEQIDIPDYFPDNLTLSDLKIPQKAGLIVIAMYREGKSFFNPSAGTRVDNKCSLMVLGSREKISKLRDLMSSKKILEN